MKKQLQILPALFLFSILIGIACTKESVQTNQKQNAGSVSQHSSASSGTPAETTPPSDGSSRGGCPNSGH
jgi:hypothetical protein